MVWVMTICLMECVSEIWIYTKVCALPETLATVHELLYALVQKAGYRGHLRAMALCLWWKHALFRLLFLLGHLYLSGAWFGLAPRMNTKTKTNKQKHKFNKGFDSMIKKG